MSALLRLTRPVDFDRLYRQNVATVYRYAFAVLGNHADAEDVTQQTFLNAYRAIDRGTKPRKAQNWLLRIAHNEVRRHFRSAQAKPREVELDEQRLPHDVPERSEPSLAEVLRALQHLSPVQREALVMREFEGRSYAEIAQLMNLTPSALEGQIFRARRALAEHLEGAFTCTEAEEALLRRLDERLPRRIGHRLKAHLQECHGCVRFADVQKRQRAVLKGLSVMPIPASLFLYRPEQAAAAGLGASAVAAGGTAAVGGGAAGAAGAGGTGLAAGFMAKAAAVTAAAAAAGGVGYGVTIKPDAVIAPERSVARTALAAAAPQDRSATPVAATRRVEQPAAARKRTAPAPGKADRPKKQHVNHAAVKATRKAEKAAAKDSRDWKQAAPHVKQPPAKAAARKAAAAKVRARPADGKKTGHTRPARPKPVQAQRGPTRPKPALNHAPAPPLIPGIPGGPKGK